jgi:prefoldin subunit 5
LSTINVSPNTKEELARDVDMALKSLLEKIAELEKRIKKLEQP